MKRTTLSILALSLITACGELPETQERSGNYSIEYVDNLRVYIGDELVAEVVSGEDATIEHDGQTFQISQLCADEDVECPSETFWAELAVDQPWGADYDLLNFVNLDLESPNPGQRMGGFLTADGSFEMLAGLAVGAQGSCAALGVATVEGAFDEANEIQDGVIAYEWAGGCAIGEVVIGTSLRIETDYVATRTGDLDLSSVTPEEPIDEEGIEVDPESPDESYAAEGSEEAVAG